MHNDWNESLRYFFFTLTLFPMSWCGLWRTYIGRHLIIFPTMVELNQVFWQKKRKKDLIKVCCIHILGWQGRNRPLGFILSSSPKIWRWTKWWYGLLKVFSPQHIWVVIVVIMVLFMQKRKEKRASCLENLSNLIGLELWVFYMR